MSGTEQGLQVAPETPTKAPVGDNVISSLEGFAFNLVDLVDELKRVRAERDKANLECAAAKHDMATLEHQHNVLNDGYRQAQETITTLRNERDDAQFKLLEAGEALAKANATLDDFRNFMGARLGTPPAVVEPAVTQPQPASNPTETSGSSTPAPNQPQAPVSEPKVVPITEDGQVPQTSEHITSQAPEVPAPTADPVGFKPPYEPAPQGYESWWDRDAREARNKKNGF